MSHEYPQWTARQTPLAGYTEVVAAAGGHPYARFAYGTGRGIHGYQAGEALFWRGEAYWGRIGHALGPVPAVEALLARQDLTDLRWLNLPVGCPVPDGWTERPPWHLRWTKAIPPRRPAQDQVVPVDDPDAVNALLDLAMPETDVRPGRGLARTWFGIRVAGQLVACATDRSSSPTGPGIIGAVAVHPDHRRQGFGAAVVAAATAWLLDRYDLVMLGVMTGNDAADRMYDGLGYTGRYPLMPVGRR